MNEVKKLFFECPAYNCGAELVVRDRSSTISGISFPYDKVDVVRCPICHSVMGPFEYEPTEQTPVV
jgi:predicted RNA-binding Zn-ribbon protein involved in translation (DUF1610 family)